MHITEKKTEEFEKERQVITCIRSSVGVDLYYERFVFIADQDEICIT